MGGLGDASGGKHNTSPVISRRARHQEALVFNLDNLITLFINFTQIKIHPLFMKLCGLGLFSF